MDRNVWFERGRVGLFAAACEREFFRDALRDVYFQTALKEGFNPQTGETVQAERQILHTDFELPLGDDYGAFVSERIV